MVKRGQSGKGEDTTASRRGRSAQIGGKGEEPTGTKRGRSVQKGGRGEEPTAGQSAEQRERGKRIRSITPISAKHTRSRSTSHTSSPLADEFGKKLEPKHLIFATMDTEEVQAIGNKSPWEALLHNHTVGFGTDSNGIEMQPPRVPLCRLMTMEVVRNIQEDDVEALQEKFYRTGYVASHCEFYLTVKNREGEIRTVDDFVDQWDPLWKEINEEFERECDKVEEFKILKNKMFWVFDGNHRLTAWSEIAKRHPTKREYHPSVKFCLLAPAADAYKKVEQAMHELNG